MCYLFFLFIVAAPFGLLAAVILWPFSGFEEYLRCCDDIPGGCYFPGMRSLSLSVMEADYAILAGDHRWIYLEQGCLLCGRSSWVNHLLDLHGFRDLFCFLPF